MFDQPSAAGASLSYRCIVLTAASHVTIDASILECIRCIQSVVRSIPAIIWRPEGQVPHHQAALRLGSMSRTWGVMEIAQFLVCRTLRGTRFVWLGSMSIWLWLMHIHRAQDVTPVWLAAHTLSARANNYRKKCAAHADSMSHSWSDSLLLPPLRQDTSPVIVFSHSRLLRSHAAIENYM